MIIFLAIALITSSCSEDDEVDPITVTVDDAAELLAFSLANRTYGLVYDLNYVANEVSEVIDCGDSEANEKSFSEASPDGEISVTYSVSESYSRNCEAGEIVNYSFNIDQSLTSVRYDFAQDIEGAWSIAGIEENASEMIYNGPYNTSGLWVYNLEDDHMDDVSYHSTLIDLRYDPNSGRITDGKSTFALEGTSTVYEPFSYQGDIEFLGSDISIITFSTGEQYELNLETGEITPINL